jgi:gamma-glutamyl hercynylcysteine S-oxide synthase
MVHSLSPTRVAALDGLDEARERTLALVAPVAVEDLERVHSPLMSPLVWDLGHIAAFEDLWLVRRFGGEEMVRPEYAEVYDAFETPRAGRGDLPFLRTAEALDYLAAVRERARAATERRGIDTGLLHELVLRHEHQHNETMLQTISLARLEGYAAPGRVPTPAGGGHTGLELVAVPAGPCEVGAGPEGFAYDNERPRHEVWVDAFQIARRPVTNGAWMRFVAQGGYERREWWSEQGWAWKAQDEPREHAEIAGADPQAPVCHVSWFEADAYARANGARLPTEAEWEKAATLSPGGRSPALRLEEVGRVWEWTQSSFGGYPGFVAHPYREYSEVFFGERYRVLRGGSWATDARVASPTFRNWDLPERRQIFAGARLVRDLR